MRTKIILTVGCAAAIGLFGALIVRGEDAPPATPEADTVEVASEQLTGDISVEGTLGPLTRTITHQVDGESAGGSGNLDAATSTGAVQARSAGEPVAATLSAVEADEPEAASFSAAQTDPTTTSSSTTSSTTTSTTSTTSPSTTSSSTTTTTSPTSTSSTTTTPPTTSSSTTTPSATTTGESPTSTTTQPDRPDNARPQAGQPAPGGSAPQDHEGSSGSDEQAAQPSTAAVTAIASVGDTLGPGSVLYRADGNPTVVLPGTSPAWRTLEAGLSGPDVAQLETYLTGLGYDVGTVDDAYTSTTASAVSTWQGDLALDETGQVPLGSIVFANGTVTVTAVHVEIGAELAPGDAVLDIAGTDLQAVLSLDPETAALVQPGQEFSISVRNGPTSTGVIASVVDNPRGGATAYASLSEQPEVTVLPTSITARRQALATDTTLALPATALVKLDSGDYAVRRPTGELVTVKVLAVSGSTVAISTQQLQPGDRVRSA